MLFDCFISYLYMRVLKLTLGNFFLHISLCFSASSVKRPDVLGSIDLLSNSMPSRRVCTTSGRELFAFSTKHTHTHTSFCLFYHVVLCVFFL